MKLDVYLNECGDCHLIFSTERKSDVECCPKCKSENITCVGTGTIVNITEH